jgi:alpha-D-xyloside xylohydrolase
MPNFGSMAIEPGQLAWAANDPVNQQLDVFITTFAAGAAGATAAARQIMAHYVDATGHSPVLPEWAAGYWHSPMGNNVPFPADATYNQTLVISAVDGLHARGIPVDLYVIDYMHWAAMGDYTFSEKLFPDPAGMVRHLASKGVRLMVSAWPYTDKTGARASAKASGENAPYVKFPNGSLTPWPDAVCDSECYLYDPFAKEGREFVFGMLDSGYVKYGVKNFWFDASEPENLRDFGGQNQGKDGPPLETPLGQPQGATYALGTNQQVACWARPFPSDVV